MKRYILFVLSAISVIACTQPEIEEAKVSPDGDKIYASIASTETKVQLNDLKQTVWTEGDEIYVIGPDIYALYQFDGETGDRSGSFTIVATSTPPNQDSHNYHFDQYYAIYSWNASYSGYGYGGDGVIFTSVKVNQPYMENSYGLYANTMVATSPDGTNYSFKNVLGYLRVSLVGEKKVRSITLSGNNNETLSGGFFFDLGDIYTQNWYDWDVNNPVSSYITLDCGETGVQLSNTPKDFYFVVPPMVFESGISININFTDGTSLPQSTTKQIEISANTIQPMSTVSTFDSDWNFMYIYHTGLQVSFPVLTGGTSVSGTIDFGDGNSYTLGGSYTWIYEDGEPSHTITVKSKNAGGFIIQGCDGITRIDLTNF